MKNLDAVKSSRIDQISAKFFKDGALVTTIHLANITNLSITLNTFPSKCKVAKKKPLFRKGIETETKIIDIFLYSF